MADNNLPDPDEITQIDISDQTDQDGVYTSNPDRRRQQEEEEEQKFGLTDPKTGEIVKEASMPDQTPEQEFGRTEEDFQDTEPETGTPSTGTRRDQGLERVEIDQETGEQTVTHQGREAREKLREEEIERPQGVEEFQTVNPNDPEQVQEMQRAKQQSQQDLIGVREQANQINQEQAYRVDEDLANQIREERGISLHVGDPEIVSGEMLQDFLQNTEEQIESDIEIADQNLETVQQNQEPENSIFNPTGLELSDEELEGIQQVENVGGTRIDNAFESDRIFQPERSAPEIGITDIDNFLTEQTRTGVEGVSSSVEGFRDSTRQLDPESNNPVSIFARTVERAESSLSAALGAIPSPEIEREFDSASEQSLFDTRTDRTGTTEELQGEFVDRSPELTITDINRTPFTEQITETDPERVRDLQQTAGTVAGAFFDSQELDSDMPVRSTLRSAESGIDNLGRTIAGSTPRWITGNVADPEQQTADAPGLESISEFTVSQGDAFTDDPTSFLATAALAGGVERTARAGARTATTGSPLRTRTETITQEAPVRRSQETGSRPQEQRFLTDQDLADPFNPTQSAEFGHVEQPSQLQSSSSSSRGTRQAQADDFSGAFGGAQNPGRFAGTEPSITLRDRVGDFISGEVGTRPATPEEIRSRTSEEDILMGRNIPGGDLDRPRVQKTRLEAISENIPEIDLTGSSQGQLMLERPGTRRTVEPDTPDIRSADTGPNLVSGGRRTRVQRSRDNTRTELETISQTVRRNAPEQPPAALIGEVASSTQSQTQGQGSGLFDQLDTGVTQVPQERTQQRQDFENAFGGGTSTEQTVEEEEPLFSQRTGLSRTSSRSGPRPRTSSGLSPFTGENMEEEADQQQRRTPSLDALVDGVAATEDELDRTAEETGLGTRPLVLENDDDDFRNRFGI